jgi:hypothetical protein
MGVGQWLGQLVLHLGSTVSAEVISLIEALPPPKAALFITNSC